MVMRRRKSGKEQNVRISCSTSRNKTISNSLHSVAYQYTHIANLILPVQKIWTFHIQPTTTYICRVIENYLCTWWLQYRKKCTETFWSPCIIDTSLLALRHSDIFRPSEIHLQGLRQLHFNS